MPRLTRRQKKIGRRQRTLGSIEFQVEDVNVPPVPGILVVAPQPSQTFREPGPQPLMPQNTASSDNLSDNLTDISSTPSISRNSQTSVISTSTLTPLYLPLKLAADLIPKFDGKSCSLTKFVKQCKVANSRIKPLDQDNLLPLIRNKIEGHADKLIETYPDPRNLNDLITILKSAFARDFNVDRAHDDLKNVHQGEHEQVEFFGARVSEILNRGLEAAKEMFNDQQVLGVRVLLNKAAVMGFTRGLRDRLFSTIIIKEEPESLNTAIDIAARLEREVSERPTPSRIGIREARTYTINSQDIRTCYNCHQPGHIASRCFQPPKPKCQWCGKYGHREEVCRSKLAGNPRFNPYYNPNPRTTQNASLNSMGGQQSGTSQPKPLIAHSNITASATNSK